MNATSFPLSRYGKSFHKSIVNDSNVIINSWCKYEQHNGIVVKYHDATSYHYYTLEVMKVSFLPSSFIIGPNNKETINNNGIRAYMHTANNNLYM